MLGLFHILLFWLAGNAIAYFTGSYISGNVIGMVLLFAALRLRIVKPHRVRPAARFLLGSMGLFFVPFGVGLMVSYDLIARHLWAIAVASIVSTLLVLLSVGWTFQKIRTFIDSDMFLLTLTVGLYCGGVALHHRLRLAILHPTLLAFVALILFLKVCGIDYGHYRQATEILDFLLGMSVVALGYLMYEQTDRLRGQVLPILTSIGVGCTVGVLSVVYIARALGADRTILNSIAPKSVTVPIAVAISEPLGGVVSVTSVVVFLVGIFGSIVGPRLLRRCGIRNPLARGLALGSAAHGIGTARAIELGAVEGALSGLAMALMGIVTALLVPLFEKFCY